MANELLLPVDVEWSHVDTSGGFSSDTSGVFTIGKSDFGGGDIATFKGALHFGNCPIPQGATIIVAELRMYVSAHASGSRVNTKAKCYGVKEGNPDSGNPFGRSKTTANNSIDVSPPNTGDYVGLGITSILQEIVNQGGYAQGNAIEFLVEENGGTYESEFEDDEMLSFLYYKLAADPDFFPDPSTVTAASLPAPSNIGIRISRPGVDVKTAAEEDLYLTTRKKGQKVAFQDSVSCTAHVDTILNHNLGYKPFSLCYARINSKSFKVPRMFLDLADPIGSDLEVYIQVTSTQLIINCNVDAVVYYFIFLDEQAT